MKTAFFILGTLTLAPTPGSADWPRWRGADGQGNWNPQPLPKEFYTQIPTQLWTHPLGGGYSGITTQEERLYVLDKPSKSSTEERIQCLNANTGETLWSKTWPANYQGMDYGNGPRSSVTLTDQRAYLLGATGEAICLNALSGELIWQVNVVKSYDAQVPTWGFAASPLLDREKVLLHVGANPNGSILALHRETGKRLWQGGPDPAGYCTPEIINHEGHRQLISWGPKHIQSLNPETGELYWKWPYEITYGVSIAQPLFREGLLLVSGYWHGTKALQLGQSPHEVSLAWENEKEICGLMSAPLYHAGIAYWLDKTNGLQAFEIKTGKILWKDSNSLTAKDRNPQLSLVWIDETQGLAALLNAEGELIYLRLTPHGFEEMARHQIIGKTWAHPAFDGPFIFARSDREITAWQLW